jgi:TPR repeat protein
MKRRVSVLGAVVLIALNSMAHAGDRQDAAAAYKRGDYVSALHSLAPAAERGDPIAQCQLGFMYQNGLGTAQDYKLAALWYSKAAEQSLDKAQYSLALLYLNGVGVARDYEAAIHWLNLAAAQGHAEAQYNLGVLYTSGTGVPKDYHAALDWFSKSAAHGNAHAQYGMGFLYAHGYGVAKDDQAAFRWFLKAADGGEPKAQRNLASMYRTGRGVARDDCAAASWYAKAARQGSANAQSSLTDSAGKELRVEDAPPALCATQPLEPSATAANATSTATPAAPRIRPAGSSTASPVSRLAGASALMDLYNRFNAEQQAIGQYRTDSVAALEPHTLLAPETLTNELKLRTSDTRIRNFEIALNNFEEMINASLARIDAGVAKINLTEADRQTFNRSFTASRAESAKVMSDLLENERAFIREIKALHAFAADRLGAIEVKDNKLQIANAADREFVNDEVNRIHKLAEHEEEIMAQAEKIATRSKADLKVLSRIFVST